MKMKKIGLLLLMACIGLFVACNDDPTPNPEDNYAADVEGTYGSVLDINVPGLGQTIDQKDIKVTREDNKTIKVELNNFEFAGQNIGNIVIDKVTIQKNGEGYSLVEKKLEKVELANGDIIADIQLTGTIEGDESDFDIVITNVANFTEAITVKAKGLKGGQYTDDNAKRIEGTYNSELSILISGESAPLREKKDITLTATETNKVKFDLKAFSFGGMELGDIAIEGVEVTRTGQVFNIVEKKAPIDVKGIGTVEAVLKGKVQGANMSLTLDIVVDPTLTVTVAIDATNSAKPSTLANLLSIQLESPVVVKQPILGINQTELEVEFGDATAEEMSNVVLKYTASDKANATPASGEKVDFTKDGKISISIAAEDGTSTKTYTLKASGINIVQKDIFDMEEWVVEFTESKVDFYAPAPKGYWATSNAGAILATQMAGLGVLTGVTQTEENEAYTGKSAAKIETFDTKAALAMIPRVTAGSLFNGYFKLNYGDQLASTNFGVPFDKKPLKLTGYYKYEPGKVFYRHIEGGKKNNPTVDENSVDKCSINAIMYDITDDESYITGKNTYTDPRIIAKAEFGSEGAKNYTQFTVDFKFEPNKTFEASKKYRIAVIMSSSAEGANFSGAPGSVLYVDDIEIISE